MQVKIKIKICCISATSDEHSAFKCIWSGSDQIRIRDPAGGEFSVEVRPLGRSSPQGGLTGLIKHHKIEYS